MSTEIEEDGFGNLVMFAARKPGQVAAQPENSGSVVNRGASSGNSNADPANGRFTSKDGTDGGDNPPNKQAGTPPPRNPAAGNTDPVAAARRRDIVRAAANQQDEMTFSEANKFLEEFGVHGGSADVNGFLQDVHQQRIDYMVEQMRPVLRSTVDALKEGNVVTVKSPKGWSSAVFQNLTDGEVLELYRRLTGQGFDPEDVQTHLIKNVANKARKSQLEQIFGETPEKLAAPTATATKPPPKPAPATT